jgi:hypothetical protein
MPLQQQHQSRYGENANFPHVTRSKSSHRIQFAARRLGNVNQRHHVARLNTFIC